MNVTPQSARRWVLVSMVLLLAMAAYKGASGKGAGNVGLARRLWGVGMLGLMLSVASDFVPQLAGPFAVLVVLGYATSGGDKAIENVLGKVSSGGATLSESAGTTEEPSAQVSSPDHPGQNP